MRLVKLVLVATILFGVLFFAYTSVPEELRYAVQDRITRLTARNFDLPPDDFAPLAQGEFIGEMRRRGYEFKCYDSPRPEEKIGKHDDHICSVIVKSAFDNIPAHYVALAFSKGRLSNAKIEFPEESFVRLESYLERRLRRYPRTSDPRRVDIFGKPLAVWITNDAMIITSAEPTTDQPLTLLWTAVNQH